VTWAARRLGRPLPGRVTGVDIVPALAARAAERGWRLFLLGAAPGVAEEVATRLRAATPSLLVAGCHAGRAGPDGDAETRRLIVKARPDIVLVAYGAPSQEFWVERNLPLGPARVGIGVGGTFDYLSGRVPRAPGWMRRAGLEWLFRLFRQPWRAGRMAVLPLFAWEVLRSKS
jgi:N-acetylglucosaminyldiphosphoundecaprenol N-acetyl-beta-D-mannosaminyltransferase